MTRLVIVRFSLFGGNGTSPWPMKNILARLALCLSIRLWTARLPRRAAEILRFI